MVEVEGEKVVIVYETHSSRGLAYTSFDFDPEPLSEPKFVGGGTHKKYLAVVRKGTVATVTRVSNKGNVRISRIMIDRPMFINFLGGVEDLEPTYIQYAKKLGLI